MSYMPCRNPKCGSYGYPHPHCNCYGRAYADGGEVECMGDHEKSCEHYADGGQIEGNMEMEQNPGLSVDHHVFNNGLHHVLTKTGKSKSELPHRVTEEFIQGHRNGRKALHNVSSDLFSPKPEHKVIHDEGRVKTLKTHIEQLRQNPSQMLDIGGSLGDILPVQHAELAAKAATTFNYLDSIRPQGGQAGPLDAVTKPSRIQENLYNRQLALAENPALMLEHVRNGTVAPQDIVTMHTVYPKLTQKLIQKTTEALIDAKSKGARISRKTKIGLSAFLGVPLDFTQSLDAVRAIMIANSPLANQAQASQKKSSGKATNKAVDESNKNSQLEATQLQSLQIQDRLTM